MYIRDGNVWPDRDYMHALATLPRQRSHIVITNRLQSVLAPACIAASTSCITTTSQKRVSGK